jgi:transposase-like protein
MHVNRNKAEAERWVAPRGRRWSRRDAEQMAAALKTSGQSTAAFAKEHGLTGQRVYWWLARLEQSGSAKSKEEPRPRFVPVRVVQSSGDRDGLTAPKEGNGLEILIGTSTVIRVRRGFDNELLRSVVATLREGSC